MAVNYTGRSNYRASTFPIIPLDEYTETASSDYIDNPANFKGVRVYVECDDATDTPSVVFTIEVRGGQGSSTDFHSLLASTAVTAAGRQLLEVYPGGAAAANVRATHHIGRGFRVTATHADADPIEYSVVGEWLN